jgi:tetratricopeptide (TPR) repeat protein
VHLHDAGEPDAEPPTDESPSEESAAASQAAILADAFRRHSAGERLALCVQALEYGRTPAALVAVASVCMEVNDLEAAARDLEEAVALAPDWPAVHFERGKLWLRRDDMEQASQAFRAAAERLPSFGPAWANLGATLGELDRPDEALAAFERALECDPLSHQTVNNIGVVKRELGRLGESEAAFKQVIALAPTLAFGHYNLGHTLFLQGRYHAALSAYSEGQKRDPERNPVQSSRLALCRLATGDPDGALAELRRAISPLPQDYRRQLLADTSSILMALLTHRPDLAGWDRVNAWVSTELRRVS